MGYVLGLQGTSDIMSLLNSKKKPIFLSLFLSDSEVACP
jgi:hypothetical protein